MKRNPTLSGSTAFTRAVFGGLAAAFAAITLVSAVLLSAANDDYARLAVERQAAQAAASIQGDIGVLVGAGYRLPDAGPGPAAASAGIAEGVLENVLGASVYVGRDRAALSWGTRPPEPRELERQSAGSSALPFGDRIYWRADGTVWYLKAAPGQSRLRQMMQGMMGGRRGLESGRPDRAPGETPADALLPGVALAAPATQIVVHYDGQAVFAAARMRQLLIVVLGMAGLGLLGGLGALFVRIQNLQRSLDEQATLARLGGAARTLAHEVRNPLSIIVMQKSLLERRLPPEYRPALESIGEETDRIEGQIRQVRELLDHPPAAADTDLPSAGGSCELAPGAWLAALAASQPGWAGRVAAAGAGHTADRTIRLALGEDGLRSIVVNLVQNALEAGAGQPAAAAVQVEWHLKRRLVIEVRDQAGGVPRALRGRIFDAFFTTKPQGSGVGLHLSRRLAESAGGRLDYRPYPPRGSCFRLSLPHSAALSRSDA